MFRGNAESSPSVNRSWRGWPSVWKARIEIYKRVLLGTRKVVGFLVLGTKQEVSVANIDGTVGVSFRTIEIRPHGDKGVDFCTFLGLFGEVRKGVGVLFDK